MRLIDSDRLKEVFDRNTVSAGVWNEIIDMQPTAYDVDKVVEEMEKKMFTADLYEHGWEGQTVDNLLCYGDIHDILKGGL